MSTASQILHRIAGSRRLDECVDVEMFYCWVCGGRSERGQKRWKWAGANFTGQNKARCPESDYVCEACVMVMAGRPPDTERMWSHLVEGDTHERANKGQKPSILAFLRRRHSATWFAAIADSGQKHIIPWCQVNTPHRRGGVVLFEEMTVTVPESDGEWGLVDAIAQALTDGLTKEGIASGDYGPRAWQLLGAARLRDLERRFSSHRGGAWFDLALWLAQRDEAAVQARLDAEKVAKEAKKNAGRGSKGEDEKPHRRGGTRTTKRVPPDARLQRAEALGSDPGPTPSCGANEREPGGVAHDDDAHAPVGSSAGDQLTLLS